MIDLTENTPDAIAWQHERSSRAAAELSALPARAEFLDRVTRNITDARRYPVIRRGDSWFQRLIVNPDDDHASVVVADAPTGAPRVLLDPNALSASRGTPVALVDMIPSPDGTMVAVTIAEAGTERNELQLIDAVTGEVLAHRVEGSVNNFAWDIDSTGFWYSLRDVVDGRFEFPLHHRSLSTGIDRPISAPAGLMDPDFVVSSNGAHVALRTGNTEQRFDWIIRDDAATPFLHAVPGGCIGMFHGDDLIAIVDDAAPHGRLVRIPVATAEDTSTWTELRAESDDVLRSVAIVGDAIILGVLRDAAASLWTLELDGSPREEIDLGARGTIGAYPVGASHPALPMFVSGDDEISFVRSSFTASWEACRYVVSERRLEVLAAAEVTVDDLVVRTISATSTDGAEVLAHVVHRADVDRSRPLPTLIYGYGGYCVAYLPALEPSFAAWIDAGGVFVLSHLRGGSEFGSEFWRQGTRERKQRTFDDLYAVAERLIADGWTTPAQLVVKGESNGGLLTGAAVAQRPDLWTAVISDVPVLDLVNYHRDPLTYAIGREEYGDPLVPEERTWLEAVSPLHNIEPARYPATLVTGGANDPRCPVWHVRVFVDALERAQLGDAPILMRVYDDQGHSAAGLTDASAKHADWLAFAAHHAGLSRGDDR